MDAVQPGGDDPVIFLDLFEHQLVHAVDPVFFLKGRFPGRVGIVAVTAVDGDHFLHGGLYHLHEAGRQQHRRRGQQDQDQQEQGAEVKQHG
ncbi:hypothetical protein SDC9_134821 [bioreactor metagenome]|uniref:Uncharacterized protein n=1 Tax=bioreactor metagenome TaxID=1076179 RepID=A0A645DEP9_9ZZZZ